MRGPAKPRNPSQLPPLMLTVSVDSVSADPQGPVLDESALARLAELDPSGNAGLVPRVLRTYVASLQRLLPQGSAALAANDAVALRYVAHTLKSSSASVGAARLAAVCLALERRLTPPTLIDCPDLVARLLAEGQDACQAVEQRLASAG
jgi:HPt (histidine-containing phosphotransfer) domain-containing protein